MTYSGPTLGATVPRRSSIRDRATDFPRNSILTGLLVVRGAQVFMSSREVRSLMEELASAETGRRFPVKYQVANDEGLALLMRLAAAREGLGTLLRKKLENSAEFEEDFEDFAARRLGIDTPPPLHEQHQAAARTLLTEFGFRADRFA